MNKTRISQSPEIIQFYIAIVLKVCYVINYKLFDIFQEYMIY